MFHDITDIDCDRKQLGATIHLHSSPLMTFYDFCQTGGWSCHPYNGILSRLALIMSAIQYTHVGTVYRGHHASFTSIVFILIIKDFVIAWANNGQ